MKLMVVVWGIRFYVIFVKFWGFFKIFFFMIVVCFFFVVGFCIFIGIK